VDCLGEATVEGAMKLSRACFSNFECTLRLARLNVSNKGITICILCVYKYFWVFRNFVEGAASQTKLNGVKNSISPRCDRATEAAI